MKNIQDVQNTTWRAQHRRPTIGLLLPGIDYANEERVWLGAQDSARDSDANLITIVGGHLNAPDGFSAQANVLYDLIQPNRFDGLVILSSAVGWYLDRQDLATFCGRYHPLPQISLDEVIGGIPSLIKDNYGGIRDTMRHLISVHGYRRIAFLRGPDNLVWAQERYRAYCETLAAHGLPVDPLLISPPLQGWDQAAAVNLMESFLHDRQLRPGQDIEAIVAATDNLARNAIKVLQARGFRVPYDVAVTGFDDEQESAVITPPLTTVPFPAYDMGWYGVEMLLSLWQGETVPSEVVIPAKVVIRQSCGCRSPVVLQAIAETQSRAGNASSPLAAWETDTPTSREALIAKLVAAVASSDAKRVRGQAERLFEAFINEIQQTSPGIFLTTLEDILRQAAETESDVAVWQNAISTLRRGMLAELRDQALLERAENLWGEARVLIGETAQRTQAYQTVLAEQRAQVLRELGATLITTFEVHELMNILAAGLPRLAMPGCYLALYDTPKTPLEGAKLILAYNRQGRRDVGDSGEQFPSSDLIPEAFFPQEHWGNLVLMPLYFRAQQIGFVLFESGPREGKVYEVLRGQISSALQGALLVAEITRQKYVLDTFMANVPDSIYFKDRESRITQTNQAHARLMGFDKPSQMIGKSDFDFFPEHQARPKYEQEQEIIRTGQPLLSVEEPDAQGRWSLSTKMPLRDEHGDIIGTFGISRDITPLKRAQQQIEQLNAQLHQENLRMSAELNVARRLQQMVLPMPRELTQIPGLDIVGYMQPAEEVGGDYYDVLSYQQGCVCIGIGDVTGHGLESGVLMLMTQTAIRTLVDRGETDPVVFLNTINHVLYQNIQRMRVDRSLTLAMVNYHAGQLRLIGQHEEALVVRSDGRIERLDTVNLGFPLGMVKDIRQWIAETTITLESGDGLVLYTDGVTEAQNARDEFYGLERLCAVICANWRDASAEAVKDAIVADLGAFVGSAQVYDDVTLVVLKQK